MLLFLGKRLLQLIPTLFFVSVIIFGLQQLLPGDPALAMAGEERDPAVLEQIRRQYRLDQPLHVQYLYWVGGVLSGNLGESMRLKEPVLTLIAQKFPVTLQLALMAIVISLTIGVAAGVISAVKQEHPVDYAVNLVALWGISTPNFWLGIMLIFLFAVLSGLAAGLGLRRPVRGLLAVAADHHPAGLRARQLVCRRAHAPHAQRHAAGHEQRLRAHRPRQGAGRARRRPQARHAQRADTRGDAGRAGARHAAVGRGADRAGVLHPGLRQADRRQRLQPRLRGGAGRDAGHRHHLHPAQPARRHRLRADQSAAAGANRWPSPKPLAVVELGEESPGARAWRRLLQRKSAGARPGRHRAVRADRHLCPAAHALRPGPAELDLDPQAAVAAALVRHRRVRAAISSRA